LTYIKDVVCRPEHHLALLIALVTIAPGVWFVASDAGWDGWRKIRPLRSFASFYAGILLLVAEAWRVVIGVVLGVIVTYLLLAARSSWCRSDGKCSTVSPSETEPKSKPAPEPSAWRPDPCDLAFKRKEWKACLEESSQ
jgi:hypothetical protein